MDATSVMPVLLLSLRVAGLATLLCLPAAVALAWVLARHRFPGRMVLDALVHAPLVLPPVVVGYGLLGLFGRQSWTGEWLARHFAVQLPFSTAGAVLAAAVMALREKTGLPMMECHRPWSGDRGANAGRGPA